MKKTIILSFILLLTTAVVAQMRVTIPFVEGFEDSAKYGEWVLNQGTPDAVDQWKIGSTTHSEGKKSLYITTDDGATATYGASPNVVMAYRKIQFPSADSTCYYDLSFDWKSVGEAEMSQLYVFIGPVTYLTRLKTSSTTAYGVLDKQIMNQMLRVAPNGGQALYGSKGWTNAQYTIRIAGANTKYTFVMAFVWINGNTDTELTESMPLGACVDNIQICSDRARRPQQLTATTVCDSTYSNIKLSWASSLDEFMIEYKDINAERWNTINGLKPADVKDSLSNSGYSFMLEQLKESQYDLRVRGVLGTDTSAYAYIRNYQLYCWDNKCINYIDLNNPEKVTCTTGRYTSQVDNAEEVVQVVDFGSDARESRHTIHWDQTEYDPRTYKSPAEPGIKTVPDGYLASVRLGNWASGSEAEAITYEFEVDSTDHAILLVKYALVIQVPNSGCHEPGFFLDIFDANNSPVGGYCGKAEFTYSIAKSADWNCTPSDLTKTTCGDPNDVLWKDWTTIGLNLSAYHGQKVRARFRNRDCRAGGHYAYCYFVLDCVGAKLLTDQCGDVPIINVDAPEGFDYTWYKNFNFQTETGTEVSKDKQLHVERGDNSAYTCKLAFLEEPSCKFYISTKLSPRMAFASYTMKHEPSRCRNVVRFKNTSHVVMRGDTPADDVHNYDERCNAYSWEIRSLKHPEQKGIEVSLPEPTFNCDINGDKIEVKLTAFLGDDGSEGCASTIVDTLNIPAIVTPEKTDSVEFCEGGVIFFGGQYLTETNFYTVTYQNKAGCDSVLNLNLTVHPNSQDTYVIDTICSDGFYKLDSLTFNSPFKGEIWLRNRWGCDSIVNLDLTVTEKLEVDVDTLPILCADANALTIFYDIYHSRFDSMAVRFDADAKLSGFRDTVVVYDSLETSVTILYPATVQPNNYKVEVEFYQHQSCGNQVFELPFTIYYLSSLIVQRWNDVLGIKNADYNGGYEFTGYQWYKNGQELLGETGPYLYVQGGLDLNADYSVRLTRMGDGTILLTCPMTPQDMSTDENIPTLVKKQQNIRRSRAGVAMWINSYGEVVYTQYYTAQQGITVPSLERGYYMLTINDGERVQTKKMLIEQ